MRWSPFTCCLFWLLSSPAWAETQTVSLARYLSLAGEQGFNIIFSTALVRPHFKVTFDSGEPLTRDKLVLALHAYHLDLRESATDQWLVVRQPVTEPVGRVIDGVDNPGLAIEEVVVTSSLHEFQLNHIAPSMHLDREQLASRPVPANDVFRVTTRLPGAADNGVSSRASIRGGRENETLILFDGVRLYEPFHLNRYNQLFSVFDNRTVSGLDVIMGGFPASYGDRLSGVMEIEPVDPSDVEDFRELGVGLYNASWMQRGTVFGQDYLFSARRSTIDLFSRLAESELGTPAFGDLYFTLQSSINDATSLSANVLWFGDDLDLRNTDETESTTSSYGNTYLWMVLRRDEPGRFLTESRVGFTAIKDDRTGRVNRPGMVTGTLMDDQEFRVYTLAHREVRYLGKSRLEYGVSYRYLDADYGVESTLMVDPRFAGLSNFERPTSVSLRESHYGSQGTLYASLKRPLTTWAYIEAGLRADGQHHVSGDFETEVTPRIGLLFHPVMGGDLRLSWGEFTQAPGIHELDISDGIDDFPRLQKAVHRVLSFARPFGPVDARIELYEKETSSPAAYFDNLTEQLSLVPELQVDRIRVAPDRVYARGVELSLSMFSGDSEWWFNYTRAEVEETENGRTFLRDSHQRYAVNAGWSTAWGAWQSSLSAGYHAGAPTTGLQLDNRGIAIAGERNSESLSSFLSVDLKLTREWQLSGSSMRLEAGVTNVLNRENPVGNRYEMEEGVLVVEPTHALPLAPFLDVYWRF